VRWINQSGSDIRAFKGVIRFRDPFGEKRCDIRVRETQSLGRDQTSPTAMFSTVFGGTCKPGDPSFEELRYADLRKLRITWIPQDIILGDGTRLE
jgi:hypothetical protein